MSTVNVQDVMAVKSRVSWGAVFAGAVVGLALMLLFSILGTAAGLSVREQNVGPWAGIWAVVSILISLFVGGWVASQCAVGENKLEGAIHGVLVWGISFAILLWLMAGGVQMGLTAAMGMALTEEQVSQLQAQIPAGQEAATRAVNDPQAVEAAWWSFFGILLSMVAAVGGALVGAGPTLALQILRERFAVTGTTFQSRERVTH